MNHSVRFDDALDAVEQLPPDDQAELIGIVRRRLVESRRQQLLDDVTMATEEHAAGGSRPVAPDELMREILS